MLHFINGNLVDSNINIMVHQCNCFATMGSGIASQIASKYPEVKEADSKYCHDNGSRNIFGTLLALKLHDERYCVNFYSQFRYGRERRHTDYGAFKACLDNLAARLNNSPSFLTVGFPFNIGCGLAGGDWSVILPMIQQFADSVPQEIYIVSLK